MIDAMLKLSRLTKMEYLPGQVEFSKLVEEVLQELALTEPNRCVKTVVEPDLTVTGDADLLKILMSNLIGNAWKYSARSEQACIEFGIMTSSHVPVYFVRDNGAGFDMNQVGKLFQVFTRLHDHSEFSGSGIGLVTAQRIITRHAGRIWAEGAVGCGATFYFTLAPAEKMQRSSDTENSVSISLSSRER
jgi:light-regulated signal transduction histidine kinase (bacteriophytochrome)